ncbi:three component ABC system middle component [uncultured Thiodictyon sp.]|uniref:three component ABC system middle component n=1 Tax=uncultured Thiodictyon sp. TaxID=1846217 RepID=UPI0025CD9B7D|nr:three component ABC system middle component [uncultured Thiodictyon sp.]
MSLRPWSQRPVEEARLLNPAFLAVLTWACARGYGEDDGNGVPFPLLFVALPVVLHKATRQDLPRTVSTPLAAWLADRPEVQVRFAERALALVPLVKEGILFGTNGQLLQMSSPRILAASRPRAMTGFLKEATAEVAECVKKTEFVGKWFAHSGEYSTVMALWGMTP